jgi:chromate transporter
MTIAVAAGTVPFAELVRVFGQIGLLSFGGPAAQIALMHRILVERRKWLDEATSLSALNFCMLLPGPEAMQLATYAGWRLHGLKGGLVAGLLFVGPGALIVLALTMIYAAFGNVPFIQALFVGVKAAVLVIVVEALLRVAKRALKQPAHWAIAGLAFVALFFFAVPFPLVIIAAAFAGALLSKSPAMAPAAAEALPPVSLAGTARTVATWLVIWWAPVGLALLILGPGHVLLDVGVFFSKLAVVTFGGAYAVLAYMAQQAVEAKGWLTAGEMLDGLGLAETTPGPLILVTELVGFLGALRKTGSWGVALLGAAMTLWVTFAPCFMWIFAGAPYLERFRRVPWLASALSGITAAVVGVILNLSLWFALQVLFRRGAMLNAGPVRMWWPDLASVDWLAVVLAAISAVVLLKLHTGIAWTLALSAGLALLVHFAGYSQPL